MVVTKPYRILGTAYLSVVVFCILYTTAYAAVLPEDRADAMFHSYSGGGVTIQGPSILIRKSILDTVSVKANYYVDSITSASVDVEARASEYEEERTEYKLGVDYLHNKTMFSFGYTNSEENDFSATTYNFSVSQDFFGDMTTLSMTYARGDDEVRATGNDSFLELVDRQNYRLGLTQVLSKKLIANAIVEVITDEGYLNNPYRAARFLDPSEALGYGYQTEIYPETRTSTAFSLRTAYYLPYRAALHNEYRFFNDTWEITAHNFEVKYVQPVELGFSVFDAMILELKFRYYTQSAADFYADLFPFRDAQNFMARDKEMSEFQVYTFGAGLELEFATGIDFFKRSSLNVFWDFSNYDYQNFRDVNATENGAPFSPGTEPLYNYSANVVRIFFSLWY